MIILLDTSTPVCHLTLVEDGQQFKYQWQADRTLATGLLSFLEDKLGIHDKTLHDVSGVGVFCGPGSFTGLRIGITVLNTLADAQSIPIVGSIASDWQRDALARLASGQNDEMVLPFYGGDAHITTPRK